MKKRKLAVMLTAALAISVLALSGCSQNSAPAQSTPPESSGSAQPQDGGQAPDLLAQIQEKGEIVVAMEGTWAPWTYHDESDALVGFDVEVAQNIAEKLGVTATFVEGEWDGLLAGLDAGRYDIMVNGVDITEDRAAKYDFSTPYAYNRTAVIVSGDNGDIQAMEDLSGKHTANTISSTYATVAEQYGAEVTGVDDLNQTFELPHRRHPQRRGHLLRLHGAAPRCQCKDRLPGPRLHQCGHSHAQGGGDGISAGGH